MEVTDDAVCAEEGSCAKCVVYFSGRAFKIPWEIFFFFSVKNKERLRGRARPSSCNLLHPFHSLPLPSHLLLLHVMTPGTLLLVMSAPHWW